MPRTGMRGIDMNTTQKNSKLANAGAVLAVLGALGTLYLPLILG